MSNQHTPSYEDNLLYVSKGFFETRAARPDGMSRYVEFIQGHGAELDALSKVVAWAKRLEDAGCAMANIIGEYPSVWLYEASEEAGEAFFELACEKGLNADPLPVIRKVLLGFFFQCYTDVRFLEVCQCSEHNHPEFGQYIERVCETTPQEGAETFWTLYVRAEQGLLQGLADGTEEDIKGLLSVLLGSPVALDGKDVYKTLS